MKTETNVTNLNKFFILNSSLSVLSLFIIKTTMTTRDNFSHARLSDIVCIVFFAL